jgi:c-di-GMP-binding flagellar brake protein YcgR
MQLTFAVAISSAKGTSMKTERREQERFSLNTQARVSFRHHRERPPEITTVAANISSGGAFLQTDHRFPMAAKVQVEFYLAVADLHKLKFILAMETLRNLQGDHLWVTTSGVIIRQDEHGVAVIFDTDYQFTPLPARP